MAKTYTLQGTVNAGFSTRWTDEDWREYTTANSLSGDENKRRIIGKYNSNYRAVNITFDSTQLAALQGKTVTSVSLTVKLLVGEVAANSNLYKIGFKKNATASSSSTSADAYARESGSTTNGYVRKASSKMTAGSTYTITSTDGLSQSVPSYGYAIGVSQSATSYIILDTTATLTVVTNETDYSITLSYNANGGSGGPSAETKTGTASGTPSVSFTVSNTKPTRANASAGSYTVTYNPQSGSVSPTSASAARTTSYTFSKWNTKSGGGGTNYVGGNTITLSSSATLYAQWTSSTTTASVTLPTPTRDGYNFNGWYTAASGGTKVGNAGASYTPPSDKTLYAQWTIKTYTVSYNDNGGSGAPSSQTKTHGTDLTLSSTKPTKSQTTTTYTVTYNANSGSVSPASATATKTTTYTFSTWNTKSDGTGNSYSSGGKYTANASATLYARYTSSTSTTSVTLPTPTRTSYTFNGWYTATSGGTKIGNGGDSYTPTANIIIYAQWTIVKYTISYNANGGNASSVPDSQTKDYNESGFKLSSKAPTHANGTTTYTVTYNANEGSVGTASATATKTTTYTFSNWNTAANGSGTNYAAGASYTANANATMYAQWTSSASTTSVTLPTPSRTGYAFSGWYTAASGGTRKGGAGDSYTPTATITLYAQWTKNTYTVSYEKNTTAAVSNMPSNQTKTQGVDLTLSSNVPTRSGYTFKGWATSASGSVAYAAGGKYTANADVTLYAVWWANKATLSTVSNTTIGSTGTATWSIPDSTYTYKLKLSYTGAADVSYDIAANTGSKTFTIPNTWLSALPNTTSATATATLTTYRGSTSLGSATKTFTVSVDSSVKPTVSSFTATHKSSNSTVSGWATYTQGYSYARLTVSATAGTGASVSSIKFSGPGISTTGTATTADTSVFDTSGTKTFTVTVTDSRGRAKSSTVTVTVYAYSKPTISRIETYRCESDGTINNGSGTYMKFKPHFSVSSVNSKNSVQTKTLKWRLKGGSWNTYSGTITDDTFTSVVGSGNIGIASVYEVQLTVTDKLTSSTYTTTLPGAAGIWYAQTNDRLGLGSPPEYANTIRSDWVPDIVPRRASAQLSSAGWYRVMQYTGSTTGAQWASGVKIDFAIATSYSNANNSQHTISMVGVYHNVAFMNELSYSNATTVDKIRYTYGDDGNGYVDIHYNSSNSNLVHVDFVVHHRQDRQTDFSSVALTPVADSPSGETVLPEYTYTFHGNGAHFSDLNFGTLNGVVNGLETVGIANGASKSITFANSSSAVMFSNCVDSSGQFVILVRANSGGVISQKTLGSPNITVTSSTNTLTIANSAGYMLYILIMRY